MKTSFTRINGSVTAPRGFRAAGIAAGIKTRGKKDMALIVCDKPAVVAAVFTTNQVKAAPVKLSMQHAKTGKACAIVANSGNANACTGSDGIIHARAMACAVARRLGCADNHVLVCSTGRIGINLPIVKVEAGIKQLLGVLSPHGGVAAPQKVLTHAVNHSFNRISVDGDTSTNDTVILLANGVAGAPPLGKFQEALNFVCLELAKMIVRDGEGVSKFVTLNVHGAASDRDALIAARSVANSVLVKTSWCGGDPNWGRILDALGYSRAKVDEDLVEVAYNGVSAFRSGMATRTPLAKLRKIVAQPTFMIDIHLHLGRGHCTMHTCDLTEKYVELNKGE